MGKSGTLEKDYQIVKEIGRGGFGVVYKAIRNHDQKEVAIKIIDKNRVSPVRLSQELKALRSLKSMHVVEFYDDFTENDNHCIVMEYCLYGSLRQYIKENGPLSDKVAAFILRQLVLGVNSIHKAGMMHRDLSTGNVLIYEISKDGNIYIKLADFGLATNLNTNKMPATIVGTPGFIAPQVYERSYGPAADVYSLGCILYSMLTGKEPPRQPGEKPDSKDFIGLSDDAVKLCKDMMNPDPDIRIPLLEIQRSAFSNRALGITVSRDGYTSRERSYDSVNRSRSRGNSHPYQRSSKDRTHKQFRSQSTGKQKLSNGKSDSAFESDTISQFNDKDLCSHVPRFRDKLSRPSKYNVLGDYNRPRNELIDGRKTSTTYTTYSNFSLKTIGGSVGSKKDKVYSLEWPLKINFLGTISSLTKSGRFSVSNGITFIFESVDSKGYMHAVMVVDQKRGIEEQVVKLYILDRRIKFSEQICVVDDILNERHPIVYTSINDLMKSRLANECYTRMYCCSKKFAGRVAKITINSPMGLPRCIVKYMFNGDFRIVFPDGRVAVQKVDSLNIICTDINNRSTNLSNDEIESYKHIKNFCLSYKNICSTTNSSEKENFILPPDKYKLKYSRNDGKMVGIQTEDSQGIVRLLRESTTQKNGYIFTEKGGCEKRFMYNGQLSTVPSYCKAMLLTFIEKKKSHSNN
ncbi:Serine/threonine-protein kinase PLK4 [Strongyloides ratti]|uniref:Serine/threonine-protein kinase PLK4 n=1 Tax=Strongyloides ratti TaxID=34506 RepID=A0A090LE65_STRRB|nr:Serine/threonine-protein kinase PLK4 [Strongyloides ratti]CEF68047.1 Serine/threonine-protein kinase PLK4 [Strongyloides ratti]